MFAYTGSQWVGYDSPTTLETKINETLSQGVAGYMLWALDLDDYVRVRLKSCIRDKKFFFNELDAQFNK
jgi:GH18 family chitinase